MVTIDVLGTPLAVTTYEELTAQCQVWSHEERTRVIDLTNTQIVTMRRHESEFRRITAGVDLFVPDGMPLIWTLNRRGADLHDRVYGPTFMRHCILNSPAPCTHYLLGGSAECVRRLQETFSTANPAVHFVGARDGYFAALEEREIVAEINRLSPDFIWVGLGTPKQQAWIHRHKAAIPRGLLLAVGFAFDVNAGMKKDAPLWMQKRGLTWVFRMAAEPRRLMTRYLRYNSLFLYYLLRDSLRRRD